MNPMVTGLAGLVIGAVLGAAAMLLIAKKNPTQAAVATADIESVVAHAKALTASTPAGSSVHVGAGDASVSISTPVPDSASAKTV